MELSNNQTVKILLMKVFEINSYVYKEMIMLDLPVMLKQPIIKRLYDFFERDEEEHQAIHESHSRAASQDVHRDYQQFCNLEDFIIHEELPQYSDKDKEYMHKYYFEDYHNRIEESI